jgi:hypothetical protein
MSNDAPDDIGFDLGLLPPPVQTAVLGLMEALVQSWPRPAAPPLLPARRKTPACPHGTPTLPCCPGCSVIDAAETVLLDVQEDLHQRYPRTPLEIHILEILRRFYPSPVTSRQLADRLGLPSAQVRSYAYSLYILNVVDRESQGHYRYKPLGQEGGVSS